MWKRVALFTFFGFTSFILILIILFSTVTIYTIEKRYSYLYSRKGITEQFWETTLSKKISLLREKISLCNIRGGKRIRTSYWHEKPARYECYLPYPDQGKPCHNSSDCQGACVIVSPTIDYRPFLPPPKDSALKEFNCIKLEESILETTYQCEKNLFKAQCASFDWDEYNQWTINDNEINFLPLAEDLVL